jgi:hypothetical protein
MVTAVGSSESNLRSQWDICSGMRAICKAVHDMAMKVIALVCSYFRNSETAIPPSEPMLNTNRTTVQVTPRTGATLGADRTIAQGPLNLVPFYRGLEANNQNVTLNQILIKNDALLESDHNYIQWLFPLPTPSGSNPTAPVLDKATIQKFRCDSVLKSQVVRSFRRMLSFYGLRMDETTKLITRAPNFATRAAVWLTNPSGHHNFLRITRIIRSLELFDLCDCSRSFYQIMQDIAFTEGRGIISNATLNHWLEARSG